MQGAAPAYGGYGAAPVLEQDFEGGGAAYGAISPLKPAVKGRRTTNLVNVIACLVMPIAVFSAVYSLRCFSASSLTCVLCFAILALVALLGVPALSAWRRRDESPLEPKWTTFMFVTCVVAWVCAWFFGQQDYVSNIQPYNDILTLNVYEDINPVEATSQMVMDAGQIHFTKGSHLDISLSMGFKNLDTYCVAPVTAPEPSASNSSNSSSGGRLPVYDFWAVGVNCCTGQGPDFQCGEYNNKRAMSGLRLMKEADRAYFRLAVQQALATYGIRSEHPLFVYWMEHPKQEIQAYLDDGHKYWVQGIGAFIGVQILLVFIAAVAFSRMSS